MVANPHALTLIREPNVGLHQCGRVVRLRRPANRCQQLQQASVRTTFFADVNKRAEHIKYDRFDAGKCFHGRHGRSARWAHGCRAILALQIGAQLLVHRLLHLVLAQRGGEIPLQAINLFGERRVLCRDIDDLAVAFR
jgi:hypothetical protein